MGVGWAGGMGVGVSTSVAGGVHSPHSAGSSVAVGNGVLVGKTGVGVETSVGYAVGVGTGVSGV